MVINANSGPSVQYGITVTSSGAAAQYNEDRGPSVDDLGTGMMDPRPFYRYNPGGSANPNSSAPIGFSANQIAAFYNGEIFIDYIPSAVSTNGLVNGGVVTGGGQNVTISATGAGFIQTQIVAPETGQAVTVWAIDSTAAFVPYGQSGNIVMWNPAAGTGRCITFNSCTTTNAGFYTIAGRDMYGYKMTESVISSGSVAGSSTVTSQKAFKYISAVTNSTTWTSTGVWIGVADVYGWPARLNYVGQFASVSVSSNAYTYNQAVLLSSVTVVLGSTYPTQGSTTPDVRGTYTSSVAAGGNYRVQMFIQPSPLQMQAIGTADASALFGPTHFSSV